MQKEFLKPNANEPHGPSDIPLCAFKNGCSEFSTHLTFFSMNT